MNSDGFDKLQVAVVDVVYVMIKPAPSLSGAALLMNCVSHNAYLKLAWIMNYCCCCCGVDIVTLKMQSSSVVLPNFE